DRLSAGFAIDLGRSLCEQGEVGHGLLWLARGLEVATQAEAADLQAAARINLAGWGRLLSPVRAVLPHGDRVRAVAFSRDGRYVLTGSSTPMRSGRSRSALTARAS